MPDLPIPDAELVDIARHHDVARDPRVFSQQRREQHPPLRIECQLVGARDVDVAEADVSRIDAALGEEAAFNRDPRSDPELPLVGAPSHDRGTLRDAGAPFARIGAPVSLT